MFQQINGHLSWTTNNTVNKLKYIDHKTKLLVHHFINKIETEIDEIPTDIKLLCILYCFKADKLREIRKAAFADDKSIKLVHDFVMKEFDGNDYKILLNTSPLIYCTILNYYYSWCYHIVAKSNEGSEVWFKIAIYTPLSKLINAYFQHTRKDQKQCKFFFNGHEINPKDTPLSLGMEEESEIDVNIE